MMRTIGSKIIIVVDSVAFLSLASVLAFYTRQQENSLLEQDARHDMELVNTVIHGLRAIMLSGSVRVAESYADQLKRVSGIMDLRILRDNGLEAYHDNDTIMDVNWIRGEMAFEPRLQERQVVILEPDSPALKQMLASRQTVPYYEFGVGGEEMQTFLTPIANQKDCHRCHGAKPAVLGLVKLTTSLASVRAEIAKTRRQAVEILLISLMALTTLTGLLIRRVITQPITKVTQAMRLITDGDLTQTVPVTGRDEIGTMAECFNTMGGKLLHTYTGLQHEQDKLTTIILSAQEGIVVTDRHRSVVLVNPSAERLLGKGLSAIVQDGFVGLFGDPGIMTSLLDSNPPAEATFLVHQQRHLSLFATRIFSPDGDEIGSAALIRDVTQEKRLEAHLRTLSYVDELTQLLNRRRMDEVLKREFQMAKRHAADLAVIMFDVDHFKRFNDEHGHDQGDRVLIALGQAVKRVFRATDLPCRFGGEEFCIILPNTGLSGGLEAAEKLRREVENTVIDGLKVTISLGVASLLHAPCERADMLLKFADQALYQSKQNGRNRVSMAES